MINKSHLAIKLFLVPSRLHEAYLLGNYSLQSKVCVPNEHRKEEISANKERDHPASLRTEKE